MDRIFLVFAYKRMAFLPPRNIDGTEVTYLISLEKQADKHRRNGILKVFELEPVDLIKNYLEVKINVSLSISSNNLSFELAREMLMPHEWDSFMKLAEANTKSVQLHLSIEKHVFHFSYSCEKSDYYLTKQEKVILPA